MLAACRARIVRDEGDGPNMFEQAWGCPERVEASAGCVIAAVVCVRSVLAEADIAAERVDLDARTAITDGRVE